MDCGWAVLSMICDRKIHGIDGLSVNQMSEKLRELTSTFWKIENTPSDSEPECPIPIGNVPLAHNPIVLLITPETNHFIPSEPFIAHWIIKYKYTFYDPEMPVPMDIEQYPKRHWHYLRILKY